MLLLALCVAGWIWVEREENSGLLLVHSARKGKLLVDLARLGKQRRAFDFVAPEPRYLIYSHLDGSLLAVDLTDRPLPFFLLINGNATPGSLFF